MFFRRCFKVCSQVQWHGILQLRGHPRNMGGVLFIHQFFTGFEEALGEMARPPVFLRARPRPCSLEAVLRGWNSVAEALANFSQGPACVRAPRRNGLNISLERVPRDRNSRVFPRGYSYALEHPGGTWGGTPPHVPSRLFLCPGTP